jgi:hypothetical protein
VQHVQSVSAKEVGSTPDVSQVANRIAASVMRWPDEPFDSFAVQLLGQGAMLRDEDDRLESIPVDAADKVKEGATGSAPVLVSADEVTYSDAHDVAGVSMVAESEAEAVPRCDTETTGSIGTIQHPLHLGTGIGGDLATAARRLRPTP